VECAKSWIITFTALAIRIGPRNIVPNLLDREKATTKQLKTKGADATKARRMGKPKPNETKRKKGKVEGNEWQIGLEISVRARFVNVVSKEVVYSQGGEWRGMEEE